MVWDSVVGIVTDYRMDGLGVYSQIFCTQPDWVWGLHYTVGTSLFLGVKWLGHVVNHPPASSVEFKERAELYFSSPSVRSWHVLGLTLLLRLQLQHTSCQNVTSV
jgi:hypothetical protein